MLLFLLISGMISAQYNFAVGFRSGGTSGITLKKKYENSAVEGIVGFWHDGLSVTALWKKSAMAFDVSNLNWYYGIGGHVSVYGENFDGKGGISWYRHPHEIHDGKVAFGVDGIVGLEYKIPQLPFAFSFDIKPLVEAVYEEGLSFFLDPGAGIKVVF